MRLIVSDYRVIRHNTITPCYLRQITFFKNCFYNCPNFQAKKTPVKRDLTGAFKAYLFA
jgi:hypothetical protein